jgi:hypothetical protein
MATPVNTDARCPACLTSLPMATSVDHDEITPKPNDVSVCIVCGAALIFTPDLRVRLITDADNVGPRVRFELNKLTQYIAERNRRSM